MKTKWDGVLTATLLACALITTGVVVYREVEGPTIHRAVTKPVFVVDWKSNLAKGVFLGLRDAPVQLIEFADFECPYCSTFHQTLKIIEKRHPNQIALTYVYFPIPGHRFAMPAARVAQCASEQGRFEEMYDQLYSGQEQFGLKPWSDYASAAGIPELSVFDACIKNTGPIPRVEEGKELGTKLDIQGTPTVIVNGWKLDRPPSVDELDAMIKAILAGKNPVSGRT